MPNSTTSHNNAYTYTYGVFGRVPWGHFGSFCSVLLFLRSQKSCCLSKGCCSWVRASPGPGVPLLLGASVAGCCPARRLSNLLLFARSRPDVRAFWRAPLQHLLLLTLPFSFYHFFFSPISFYHTCNSTIGT